MAQAFAFIALGVLALVAALFLAVVLSRLARTLGAVEELVATTTDEMRETLPEVRQTLGNVNDITAGVNVGLRTAGAGAETVAGRLGQQLRGPAITVRAAAYGFSVGTASLLRSYFGGGDDGRR